MIRSALAVILLMVVVPIAPASGSGESGDEEPLCFALVEQDLVIMGEGELVGGLVWADLTAEQEKARIWLGPSPAFWANWTIKFALDAINTSEPIQLMTSPPFIIPGLALSILPCNMQRIYEYCPTNANVVNLAAVDEFGCRLEMWEQMVDDLSEEPIDQYNGTVTAIAGAVDLLWPTGLVVPVPIPGQLPPGTPDEIQTAYGITYQLVPPQE